MIAVVTDRGIPVDVYGVLPVLRMKADQAGSRGEMNSSAGRDRAQSAGIPIVTDLIKKKCVELPVNPAAGVKR